MARLCRGGGCRRCCSSRHMPFACQVASACHVPLTRGCWWSGATCPSAKTCATCSATHAPPMRSCAAATARRAARRVPRWARTLDGGSSCLPGRSTWRHCSASCARRRATKTSHRFTGSMPSAWTLSWAAAARSCSRASPRQIAACRATTARGPRRRRRCCAPPPALRGRGWARGCTVAPMVAPPLTRRGCRWRCRPPRRCCLSGSRDSRWRK